MSDEGGFSSRQATKAAKKARLLQQVEAAFERDWADLERLAAKYPDLVTLAPQPTAAAGEISREPHPDFDGSAASLIACYKSSPDSGYRKAHYKTRTSYDSLLRRLARDFEGERIEDIDDARVLRAYQNWAADGHIAMANSIVAMMRLLANFGSRILKDRACRELRVTLHDVKHARAKRRYEPMTAEHANKIRAKAHEMGLRSVALAQAFQFECPLRQKDVIGEWLPIKEPGTSDVIDGKMKWVRGLRWSAIDQNLVLRHTTSRAGQKEVEVDLRTKPMVMEELTAFGDTLPRSGPVIVSEYHKVPYATHEFRRKWRMVARAAGVPDDVYNMDSGTANSPVVEPVQKDMGDRRN